MPHFEVHVLDPETRREVITTVKAADIEAAYVHVRKQGMVPTSIAKKLAASSPTSDSGRQPFTDDPRHAHLLDNFDPVFGHEPLKVYKLITQNTETGQHIIFTSVGVSAEDVIQEAIDRGHRVVRVEYQFDFEAIPDPEPDRLWWPLAIVLGFMGIGLAGFALFLISTTTTAGFLFGVLCIFIAAACVRQSWIELSASLNRKTRPKF